MNLQPLAQLVSKYAPLVGTALGGSAGTVVGEIIAHIFGGSINSPDDLAAKIQADPDAQVKLISLQYQHEDALERMTLQDRMNSRQVNSSKPDWIIHFLAMFYTLGFFVFVIVANVHPVGSDNEIFHDLLNVSMVIVAYYFGSSYGQDKGNKK